MTIAPNEFSNHLPDSKISFLRVIAADARFLIKIHCFIFSLIHFKKEAQSFRACLKINQTHFLFRRESCRTLSSQFPETCRVKNTICMPNNTVSLMSCNNCLAVLFWRNTKVQASRVESALWKFGTCVFVYVRNVMKQLGVGRYLAGMGTSAEGLVCAPISRPSIRSPAVWRSEMLPKWTLAANFANQGTECKEQSSARESVGKLFLFSWLRGRIWLVPNNSYMLK